MKLSRGSPRYILEKESSPLFRGSRTVGEQNAIDSSLLHLKMRCLGRPSPVPAEVGFSTKYSELGAALPSSSKPCARFRPRCFSVVTLGRTTGGIPHRPPSWPSASALSESLSIWPPPKTSGSAHGSGDEHRGETGGDRASGCRGGKFYCGGGCDSNSSSLNLFTSTFIPIVSS